MFSNESSTFAAVNLAHINFDGGDIAWSLPVKEDESCRKSTVDCVKDL